MTHVIGIDLSLTGTGVASLRDDQVEVRTVPSKGRRADSVTDRAGRLRNLASEIISAAATADLVVVEGPSIMSHGGSNWDRAGLWWQVVGRLIALDIPVAVAPPTTLKKWATGRGNADKSAVAVGVSRLWPDVECANDNESDALALVTMGAQRLGLPVATRAHHAAALAGVEWPLFLPDRDLLEAS